MSPTAQPPAYDGLPTEARIKPATGSLDQAQVERIRRFLLFCLVVDYNLTTSTRGYLQGEDWNYFMRLARLATREGITARKHGIRAEDLAPDSESQIVQREFHVPVLELGIPLSIARSLLVLFPRRVRANGEHGSVLKRNNAHTLPELATRILTDREILFDALLDETPQHAPLRKDLEAANKKVERQTFASLRSPDDYVLTEQGRTMEEHYRHDPSERQLVVLYGETGGLKEKFAGFMGGRKQGNGS
ncbi:hypothetical protein LTR62_005712 [Meristemomyces frigidus]|uniref:Uncharacterized protein n=1 Tax=Meristemomyces frigidus TaxID=1508187 RepID=A0AAN7TE54_9PEZI|nr:hypothetical protein LTR62_005712 [Meristemomyces frigidus]